MTVTAPTRPVTTLATSKPAAPPAVAPPGAATSFAALVRRGLRDGRRAPLTWGGALGVMGVLYALLYPSIEGQLSDMMRDYPSGLKEAFNITDLTTFDAYIDAELLSFIAPLALAFFAIRLVSRATVGAEENGYLDVLLAAPVPRSRLVAAAFTVAGLLGATVLAVVLALTYCAAVVAGAGPSLAALFRGMANVWPLMMAFAGLGILLAGAMRGSARVTAVAVATLGLMYVADLAGKLADLAWLRLPSAFRYYGSAVQDGLDPIHFAGLLAAGVLLAAFGAVLFERRDLGA
jgi:beta-exotoxin I transport system permease protein